MGAQFNQAFQRADQFIQENPDHFRGLRGREALVRLSELHKQLFDELRASWQTEVQDNSRNTILGNSTDGANFLNWVDQHPDSLPANVNRFQNDARPENRPPPEPPPPPGPDLSAALQEEARKRTESELQKRLTEIFGQVYDTGANTIRGKFMPLRQRAFSDEAALGRLRSPISAPAIGRIDEQEGQAIAQLGGSLAQQQATGQLDVSKTIETLLAGDREGERLAGQFGQDLSLRRDTLSSDVALRQAELAQNRELGISKLNNEKTSGLDSNLNRANSSLDILTKLASLYGNYKQGKGTGNTTMNSTASNRNY